MRAAKKTAAKTSTIYDRWFYFVLQGLTVIGLLFVLCEGFLEFELAQYNRHIQRMTQLNTFYTQLNDLNDNVLIYTQSGDEAVYRQIRDQVTKARTLLADMTQHSSADLYRRMRDLQEMFSSYVTCTDRIYEHAYLCNTLTVSSKRVVNQYYVAAEDIYQAMGSEFQNLYSRILVQNQVEKQKLDRRNRLYMVNLAAQIAVTIAVMEMQVRKMFRRNIRPIQQLTDSASRMNMPETPQEGSVLPLVPQEYQSDEEIRNLVEVYNAMIVRIGDQVAQIRENAHTKEQLKNQELENLRMSNLLKSSELQALQMQINPHYLFNMMNMISQTAFLEGADQTKQLLDKTAGLFRYTLDYSAKTVTLAREMEVVGDYVELQEERFGDRITFVFDLDESFHQVMVPGMILQPLVENALIHGVGMKTEGAVIAIRTRLCEDGNAGEIEVSDNGAGMEEDRLETVRASMKSDELVTGKIGLGNVYQRLKLMMGEQVDMTIDSRPGEGTTVRIRIDLQNGKDKRAS